MSLESRNSLELEWGKSDRICCRLLKFLARIPLESWRVDTVENSWEGEEKREIRVIGKEGKSLEERRLQWDAGVRHGGVEHWVRKREGCLNREKYRQVKYRRVPNFIFKKITILSKKRGKFFEFLIQTQNFLRAFIWYFERL